MPKNRNPSYAPPAAGIDASATRFWAYDPTPAGEPAVLRLDGPIDTETWWGDEVTPKMFRDELEQHPGDIVVYINSPGGDVIAATQIYTMLVEHRGNVTVKIDGIAASAASVVAMAGNEVLMAPSAYMMIHDAWSIAIGNSRDFRHEANVLDEIDQGIRAAYRLKTGLRDSKLQQMMEDETWMSARTCIDLGFADGYIGAVPDEDEPDEPDEPDEDEPDTDDGANDRRAVALHALPAVAYSGRRQLAALRKQLRDEEILASANHDSLAELLFSMEAHTMPAVGIASHVVKASDIGAKDPEDPDDEAPQSDPTDLARRRLALASL